MTCLCCILGRSGLIYASIRPSDHPLAWDISNIKAPAAEPSMKLKQEYSRTGGAVPQEFRFGG